MKPLSSVDVHIEVDTNGLSGSFEKGGVVHWVHNGSEEWVTKLTVSGIAVRALRTEPELITFEPYEVGRQALKRIEVKSDQLVDWTSLMVWSSGPPFKLVSKEVRDGSAICTVTCGEMENDVPHCEGHVVIRVAERASGDVSTASRWFDATVPVRARQEIDLAVSPRELTLLRDADGHADARMLLRGRALLASATPIESITVSDGQAEWKLGSVNRSGTAVLQLSMSKLAPAPCRATLTIQIRGGNVIHVPMRVDKGSSERAVSEGLRISSFFEEGGI